MKKVLMCVFFGSFLFLLATTFLSGVAVAKTSKSDSKKTMNTAAQYYTCPMHTDVRSDKPGKCPKCGMNLEKPPFRHAVVTAANLKGKK